MMSLKEEDAVSDVSDVPPEHVKILDDWCARARALLACGRCSPADGRPRVATWGCARYDKLTKKYPTVGCCEGNAFGYTLDNILDDFYSM